MSKIKIRDSLLWGLIFVMIGAGFLAWNLGAFGQQQETVALVLTAGFALAGLAFIGNYFLHRTDWWKLIPAFTLLAVAAVIYLSTRQVNTFWVAVSLLAGIGLAFIVIYLSNREERWWALIPFGSLGVMVAVILLSMRPDVSTALLGAALFGGMGLVFLAIYALARERQRFSWALVPAAALGIMALVALAAYLPQAVPTLGNAIRMWPVLVMLIGVAMIVYAATRGGKPAVAPVVLPSQPTPMETALVPGASVTTVTDDVVPLSRPTIIERSPITLADTKPVTTDANGEVGDIYDFLKSAPPES